MLAHRPCRHAVEIEIVRHATVVVGACRRWVAGRLRGRRLASPLVVLWRLVLSLRLLSLRLGLLSPVVKWHGGVLTWRRGSAPSASPRRFV